jgi:poly(3-hydroxyalkanoate) depolymerase
VPSAEAGPDTYQPRPRTVEVGNASLRVAEIGSGPPLLLIHGIGANLAMWRPLATQLFEHRRLIMFDAPGTGGSPRPGRPLRMPGLARLLGDLLDELGYVRVDVLGYSWGGTLAQQFAHDSPDRVRRLVLASTAPGLGGRPPSLAVMALMSSPLRYVSESYLSWTAPMIYGGETRLGGIEEQKLKQAWLAQPPSQLGYALQMYAISGWTSLPWLHKIRQPTLIISGADDPLVPLKNAHLLADRIPHATLHIVSGGGHLWMLEHADRSTALVNEFLSG